jgi:hypothetical protein
MAMPPSTVTSTRSHARGSDGAARLRYCGARMAQRERPKQSPMAAQTEAMRSIETGGGEIRPRGELGVAEFLPSARALGHIVAREL